MSEPDVVKDVLTRILEGGAPTQIRSAAARGALPLPRTALVRLYVALREDEEEQIRTEAEKSLAGLEHEVVLEVLEDSECAPEVLKHFAARAAKDEAMAERIAFHRSTPVAALAALASGGKANVIELVLTNQEKLLAEPDLLSLLSLNPALRSDQRGRILELLDRAMQAAAARGSDQPAEGQEPDAEVSEALREAARVLELDIGELYAASEILGAEELEQTDDTMLRSAFRRIVQLNVAQKAILAMRGGREERMILVRDTNKLVALGVLRNPRLMEADVEAIARLRSVSDEVLRNIGQNRAWAKSYAVANALINNPRTPQAISTNFVPRLQNQDLKKLTANREVPELVRRMAKRTIETRTRKR